MSALPVLARACTAHAMALRLTGVPEFGRLAAEAALAAAAEGGRAAFEHGLALAESASCQLAAGAPTQAVQQWLAALAVWDAGQVDDPELLQPVREQLSLAQSPH